MRDDVSESSDLVPGNLSVRIDELIRKLFHQLADLLHAKCYAIAIERLFIELPPRWEEPFAGFVDLSAVIRDAGKNIICFIARK